VSAKSSVYVLDNFALFAYFEGEAGMSSVRSILARAEADEATVYLSLINLGEFLYTTEREQGLAKAQQALAAIEQLPIQIVEVSRSTVLSAAHIKAHYAVSYADAFAVVTAQECNGIVVTGDLEFKLVEAANLVSVEWLPRH
jgi:ribonuclease VapC